jgi:hypothetical protein
MVRPREEAGPRVVYCDLSRLPGEAGFERSFGSPGNLREKMLLNVAVVVQ